jgi:hypothetical protein
VRAVSKGFEDSTEPHPANTRKPFLERYTVVLHTLLIEVRILLKVRARLLGACQSVCASFPFRRFAAVSVPSEQHDVLCHNLGNISLYLAVILSRSAFGCVLSRTVSYPLSGTRQVSTCSRARCRSSRVSSCSCFSESVHCGFIASDTRETGVPFWVCLVSASPPSLPTRSPC